MHSNQSETRNSEAVNQPENWSSGAHAQTRLKPGSPECALETDKPGARERVQEPGWLAVSESQREETCRPWERGLGEWLWGTQPRTLWGF